MTVRGYVPHNKTKGEGEETKKILGFVLVAFVLTGIACASGMSPPATSSVDFCLNSVTTAANTGVLGQIVQENVEVSATKMRNTTFAATNVNFVLIPALSASVRQNEILGGHVPAMVVGREGYKRPATSRVSTAPRADSSPSYWV